MLNNCDANATCDINDGGFTCFCNTGYFGDGTIGNCINENECLSGTNNCVSSKATCTENVLAT